MGIAQHYNVLFFQGYRLHTGHNLPVAPAFYVRHQQRYGAGFAQVQPARKPVGVIIQAFHHRQYMGLGFGLHLLRVVQHPADGRYRNTRRFGYFFYIDGSLTPFRRSGI